MILCTPYQGNKFLRIFLTIRLEGVRMSRPQISNKPEKIQLKIT